MRLKIEKNKQIILGHLKNWIKRRMEKIKLDKKRDAIYKQILANILP